MNKKALSLAISLAMALPSVTHALGLGDIQSNSHLNQPFKGKIQVLSASPSDLRNMRVRIAAPEVFNRVGIDRPAFLNSMRFKPVMENGKPVILVNSTGPIHEPFVNFLLEVTWPKGQLLKEYTALLDPPVLMQPGSAIASNQVGVRPEPGSRGRINRPAPQVARQAQPQRRVIVAPNRVNNTNQRARQQAQSLQIPPAALRALANVADPASASRTNRATPQRTTYRVKRGDTLYKVAKKLGYRGVKTEQMMMALYKANPSAFHQKNVNNLKAGARLQRPSRQQAKAMSYRESRAELVAQTKAWKAARQQLASAKSGATQSATGKVARKSAQASDATQGTGVEEARLEVVGSKGGQVTDLTVSGSATVVELKKQLQLASESLTARTNENAELKSRVSELESLLRKKNRLITLKSEQLAELQARLSGKKGEQTTSQGATDATTVVAGDTSKTPEMAMDPTLLDEINSELESPVKTDIGEEGTDLQQAVASQMAGESGEIIRDNDERESSAPPLDEGLTTIPQLDSVTEPEQAPVDTSAQQTQSQTGTQTETPAEQGSMLDSVFGMLSSPTATAVGGGTLLALLGGLLYMRRRKSGKHEDDAEYMDFDLDEELAAQVGSQEDANPFEAVAAESEKEKDDMFSDQTVKNSDPDLSEEGESKEENILQEADVYLVYGLHDQAEAELRKAISEEPDNLAYRAKLIENFKAAGNKEAFEKEARIFKGMDGPNKDKLWADIVEWGKSLIPESNLFTAGATGAAAAGVAVTAGKAVADQAAEQFDHDLDDLIDADAISEATTGDVSGDAETLDELDLDSILDDEPAEAETIASTESSADFSATDDDLNGSLDFDLGDVATGEILDTPAESEDVASVEDENALDFDGLDLGESVESASNKAEVAQSEVDQIDDLSGLDLDGLDLDSIDDLIDSDSADEEILAAKQAIEGVADDDLNLNLDGDFETESLETAKVLSTDTVKASEDEGLSSLDSANLSLDIDAENFNKIVPEDNPYASAKSDKEELKAEDDAFDFDAIADLEALDTDTNKSSAETESEDNLLADFDDNLSFLDLDDTEGDVIQDTQINTKLDLAKAYMDMGDIEGARSTLEEVMLEGNDEQKREAEELLHQTG